MSTSNGLTIKVLAHYARERRPNQGTAHVLWVETGIELKGCAYRFEKSGTKIYLPGFQGTIKGQKCHYPALTFQNKDLHQLFLAQLLSSWKEYAKAKGLHYKQPTQESSEVTGEKATQKGAVALGSHDSRYHH
jgi:hypothetical protein